MNISLIYVFIAFQGIRVTSQGNRDLKVKNGKDLKWKLAAQSKTRPYIASTRPCLKAVSQKSKEHGLGTRPCSAIRTLNRKSYMAAIRRHARVDVYTPMWCQYCQLLCQFSQLGELLELWAGKNNKKKRSWAPKIVGDELEQKEKKKRTRRLRRRRGRKEINTKSRPLELT